jgi:hypothetical protein
MSTSFEIVNSHIYNNILVKFHNKTFYREGLLIYAAIQAVVKKVKQSHYRSGQALKVPGR